MNKLLKTEKWIGVYRKLLEGSEEQEFDSAKTSRPQIADLHRFLSKKNMIKPGTLMLDWGGGKYDRSKDFIEGSTEDVTFLTYDPFNRTEEHNNSVISRIKSNGGADVITIANVFNVIKEKSVREDTIRQIKENLKPDGKFYVSVYNAPRTDKYEETEEFVGQPTSDGWQNAQPIKFYLPEVQKYFPDAFVKYNIISAQK